MFYPNSNMLLYTNIDQTLVNSLHRLLNCEIGGLDCHVISTEYRTRVHCIHMYVRPIFKCIDPCNLFRSIWSMFLYNTNVVFFYFRLFKCLQYLLKLQS